MKNLLFTHDRLSLHTHTWGLKIVWNLFFLACLFLVLNCASTYGYAESVKSFSDLEMVWWTTSKHLSLSQLCLKSVMNVGQKRSLTQTFWEYLCELELFFSSQNMKSAGVCGCGFVWDSIAKWFIITPPDKHFQCRFAWLSVDRTALQYLHVGVGHGPNKSGWGGTCN